MGKHRKPAKPESKDDGKKHGDVVKQPSKPKPAVNGTAKTGTGLVGLVQELHL